MLPGPIEGSTGVTAIETSTVAVTLRLVEPEMLPSVAEIVADWPAVTPFARPAELTVAAAFDEAQVTESVMFCVDPSEKVPVAVNWIVFPSATDGVVGVTAIETSAAGVTLRLVEAEMLPRVAEMVVDCPPLTPVARPIVLIVAAVVLDDAHVTEPVTFCEDPFENFPVAMNWIVFPAATDGFSGVTAIETSVATVRVVEAVTPVRDA